MAGMGNPDGSLHDATTFGEGHLTKHVPSFGVVEPETLCPTNMRATTRPYNRQTLAQKNDFTIKTNMVCIYSKIQYPCSFFYHILYMTCALGVHWNFVCLQKEEYFFSG
jgi:hypothetical protein